MLVSIIVVNYNSWNCIQKLISGLLQQQTKLELIIVDNASNQLMPSNLLADLKTKQIPHQLLQNPNNDGFATACNLGAQKASGELLLFCNPDVLIPDGQLDALLTIKQASTAKLLACAQKDRYGKVNVAAGKFPNVWTYVPLLGNLLKPKLSFKSTDSTFAVDWISGSVVLIDRHDFLTLDGWDESFFMFMEDVDLCYRAHQRGWKIMVTKDVVWTHLHGVSSQFNHIDRVRAKVAGIRSKHHYVNKHMRGFARLSCHAMIILKFIPEWSLAAFLSLILPHRELKNRRLMLRYYFQGKLP